MNSPSGDERFDALVARHLDRTLDTAGRAELAALLTAEPKRRRDYLRLLEQEELLVTSTREVLTPSARIDAARLTHTGRTARTTRRHRRRARIRSWTGWAAWAVAASTAVVVGTLVLRDGSAPTFGARLAGDVRIERAGKAADEPLRHGDVLIARGAAMLRFPDDGTVRLEPSVRLVLRADATAPRGVELRLDQGKIACDLPPQLRGFVVRTAETDVAVVGTRFSVTADPGVSRVGLDEGQVRLRHPAGDLLLSPGDQARITAGGVVRAVQESPARLDDPQRWSVAGRLDGEAVAGGATLAPTPVNEPGVWSGRAWRWQRVLSADTAVALQARFDCPPAGDGIWHCEVLVAPPGAVQDEREGQFTPCVRLSLREGVPSVGRRVVSDTEVQPLWTGDRLPPGPHLLRLELRGGTLIGLIDGREVWRGPAPYPELVLGVRWSRRVAGAAATTIDQVAVESLLER